MKNTDPKRRSILARLNLESPSSSEKKPANPLSDHNVTPSTEPERAEKSVGSSDPKASQLDPKIQGGRNEPQWDQLRRRFIESDGSLRALAAELSIPYASAKRRVKKEGWRAARASFREELDRKLDEVAVISRARAHGIQVDSALRTMELFERVFKERAREIGANPAAKKAADDLSKLITLQLDTFELSLSILGDTEIDWSAERLITEQATPKIH